MPKIPKTRLRKIKRSLPKAEEEEKDDPAFVQSLRLPGGQNVLICNTKHFRVDPHRKAIGAGAEGQVLASCSKSSPKQCNTIIKSITLTAHDIDTKDYISREMYFSYWIQEHAASLHIAPRFYEHRICHEKNNPDVRVLSLVMDKFQGSMADRFEKRKHDLPKSDVHQMLNLLQQLRLFLIVHGDVKLDQFLWRKKSGGGIQIVLSDYGFAGSISPLAMQEAHLKYNRTINTTIKKASEWAGADPRQIEFLPKIGWISNPENGFFSRKWQDWESVNDEQEKHLDALHKTRGSKYIEPILPFFDLVCFDLDLLDFQTTVDKVPYAGTDLIPEQVWNWVEEHCLTDRMRICLKRRRYLIDSGEGIVFSLKPSTIRSKQPKKKRNHPSGRLLQSS